MDVKLSLPDSVQIVAREATREDEPFLRELFFEIRAPEFAPAGLSGDQLRDLLNAQYAARKSYYGATYSSTVYHVLEANGTAAGYDAVEVGADLHLVDIAVRPCFQGRGIGTARMRQLLLQAREAGKSIVLCVEIFNPALSLYQRLGFEEVEVFGIYKRLKCPA